MVNVAITDSKVIVATLPRSRSINDEKKKVLSPRRKCDFLSTSSVEMSRHVVDDHRYSLKQQQSVTSGQTSNVNTKE